MERLTYYFSDIITGLSGTSRLFYKLSRSKLDAAISKLRDFEDAEEQGVLVRLPCKVGDTVYVVENGDITEQDIVHEMNYGRTSSGDLKMLFLCEMGVSFYGEEVGKTIFLTRKEAEAALAKEG